MASSWACTLYKLACADTTARLQPQSQVCSQLSAHATCCDFKMQDSFKASAPAALTRAASAAACTNRHHAPLLCRCMHNAPLPTASSAAAPRLNTPHNCLLCCMSTSPPPTPTLPAACVSLQHPLLPFLLHAHVISARLPHSPEVSHGQSRTALLYQRQHAQRRRLPIAAAVVVILVQLRSPLLGGEVKECGGVCMGMWCEACRGARMETGEGQGQRDGGCGDTMSDRNRGTAT